MRASPERYRGESETLDQVAGHIPGAVNHFFKWNLADDGTFRAPQEIRERLRASIGDVCRPSGSSATADPA